VKAPEQAEYYLKVGFWLLVAFASTIACAGWLFSEPLATLVYGKPLLVTPLRLGFLAVLGGILWNYLLSNLHAREMFKHYSVFSVLINLIKFAALGAIYYFLELTVNKVLWLYILAPVLGFIIGMAYSPTKLLGAKGDFKKTARSLLGFSKWIFVIDLSIMLFSRIDMLILGRYVSEESLGFYSVAYQMIYVLTILTSSFMNVLFPLVSKFDRLAQVKEYIRNIVRVTLTGAVCFLPLLLFVGPLIHLFFGSAYDPSVEIFRVIFFGFLFNFIVEPIYLVAYTVDKPQLISLVCIIKLIISASANLLLIPQYGVMGAAAASVITHVLGGSVALMIIRYYINRLAEVPFVA